MIRREEQYLAAKFGDAYHAYVRAFGAGYESANDEPLQAVSEDAGTSSIAFVTPRLIASTSSMKTGAFIETLFPSPTIGLSFCLSQQFSQQQFQRL